MHKQKNTTVSAFSTLIIFWVCCLIGGALLPRLSVQLVPSRSYSSVTVSCNMSGASQEVTEIEITNPIENVLASLKGIKDVTSNTGPGYTNVHVELDKWTDPEMFRFEVSSLLRQLHTELPSNASYPQVYLNRPNNDRYRAALMSYSLNGPGSAGELAQIAEEDIQAGLANIKGIYEASVSGVKEQRFFINTDATKLRAAQVTHQELVSALNQGLAIRNIGIMELENQRMEVVITGGLDDVNSLADYPVKNMRGRIIRLGDVADLQKGDVADRGYYRINGQNLVNIAIYPEEHINTIKLAGEVKGAMEIVEDQLPDGYQVILNYDNTNYIKEELGKIYFRTFLSVAILLLFVFLITQQLRYLFIVILSISVNVLVSLIFYYFFSIEIHLYSLAGITISIGLIIDNVIVIVEDIRHTGRNRIFAAILASTFTALGALSVIFLLEESQRINLMDFGLAIIINLIVSLPVAYFFIPALLEKLPVKIKKRPSLAKRKRKLVRFSKFYEKQIHFMLKRKWVFIVLLILSFGLPLYMLPAEIKKEGVFAGTYNKIFGSAFYNEKLREPINKYLGGASYLYISNKDRFGSRGSSADQEEVKLFVRISMPNGATLPQMNEVANDFEDYLSQFQGQLEVFNTNISSPNSAVIDISFKKEYSSSFPHRLKNLLESEAIMAGSADFQVYGVGRGFSNAINLENYDSTIALKGYNYQQLQGLALRIRDTLESVPRVDEILISSTGRYDVRGLAYEFQVDLTQPDYLAVYQIRHADMSKAMRSEEEQASNLAILQDGDDFIRLAVSSNADNPPAIWNIMQAPLDMNKSVLLRLGDMSQVARVRQGSTIRRHNQEYVLNVHYRFIGTYMLNQMVKERVIENINEDLPYGYSVYSPNQLGWWEAGKAQNLWLIGLVLLIIYMICAVLLESFRQPIAVVLMIPFSFIGVFLIFYFLELGFDQGGYAALLMLSGLVTNVALYIINDINFIKKRYRDRDWRGRARVYIKAFNAKAMPIMITTASAILSLLPFMINGEESGFWFTLSAGTIGGLLFSLLGAYFMLPLVLLGKPTKTKLRKE